MVKSTQIARIDGLLLAATVDDEQAETELADPKANAKMIIRRLNRNSEPQASIEAGKYTLQYVRQAPLPFAEKLLLRGLQLHDTRPTLLPHHLRPFLPPQTRLHLSLRPSHRVHNHLLLLTVSFPYLPPLRLCRVRHFHAAHKKDLSRQPRESESG